MTFLVQRLLRRNHIKGDLRTILVYVTGDRIGDGILKFPVIRAFKEKNERSRLIWVTGKNPSVFSRGLSHIGSEYLDEIHEGTGIHSYLSNKSLLLQKHPDTVICTETNISKTLFLRGIKARTFISPAAGFMFSSIRPSGKCNKLSVYERFLTLMNLASEKPLLPRLSLPIPKTYLDYANYRLKDDQVFAGLNPGAGSEEKK